MSRKFIPMYRVLQEGNLAGYTMAKPTGKEKEEAKKYKLTFEHIRSEEDFGIAIDRKLVIAILPGLGRAMAFKEGIAIATVKNTPVHLTNVVHYEKDDYLVLVDYMDQSPPSYTILDYRAHTLSEGK